MALCHQEKRSAPLPENLSERTCCRLVPWATACVMARIVLGGVRRSVYIVVDRMMV